MYATRHHWLTVFPFVQRVLFSVLKGTGHEVELLGAVVGTLEHLLERRAQHHLLIIPVPEVDKLSSAEVNLLDILLQVLHHSNKVAFMSWSLCRLNRV